MSACRKLLIKPTYCKPFFTSNDVNTFLSQKRSKYGLTTFLLKCHIQSFQALIYPEIYEDMKLNDVEQIIIYLD